MYNMTEEEFAKIEPTTKPEECNHQVVRLCFNGAHTDYGCVKCKAMSFNKEDFEKNSK